MSFLDRFKRKKPEEGLDPLELHPLELNVSYFIPEGQVRFDLNGLDFTFEGIYVRITEEWLKIFVDDEVPMNLMNITAAVQYDEDMEPDEHERLQILEADTVKFVLKLKDDIFNEMKDEILKAPDVRLVFQIDKDGEEPVRKFENYLITEWGMKKTEELKD